MAGECQCWNGLGMDKLTISISSVELHAVETNLEGQLSSLDKIRDGICHVRLCHRCRRKVAISNFFPFRRSKGELFVGLPSSSTGADNLLPCWVSGRHRLGGLEESSCFRSFILRFKASQVGAGDIGHPDERWRKVYLKCRNLTMRPLGWSRPGLR